MTAPFLFKEYIWLVDTIRRAKAITLADINRKWMQTEMSEGMPLSRTTFYRHKYAIEDIFGIYIECDRKNGNKYYIGNDHVLREDSVQNWMLSTLSVSNLLGESQSLHHRILLENIPSGDEKLQQIIAAMKQNRRVRLNYCRYGFSVGNTFLLSPYCIKLFHRRWYLLGKFDKGKMSVFSFDRMKNVEILDEKFNIDDDFDASDYFSECFGIVVGDGTKAEKIVLRAYGTEANYVRDLPLHHSQCEIDSTDEYADFELFMRPTSDFKAHLLSRGQWAVVLEPQWLADEIVKWHRDAIEKYQKQGK